MKSFNAFNGDQSFKDALIAEVKLHMAADAIAAGSYVDDAENSMGHTYCAVGCAINSMKRLGRIPAEVCFGNHERYAEELNIHVGIVYLQDAIFEGLDIDNRILFPLETASSR